MTARELYHRLVPAAVRFPVGRLRRGAADRWLRLLTPAPPLPPRRLLQRVQTTPWAREFLEVGRRSAEAIAGQLAREGLGGGDVAEVLDFGCGLGRTLRHLGGGGWRLHGCDVDDELLPWCRRAAPGAEIRRNEPAPPLPYPEARFDALWAVSVFSHFPAAEQTSWARELARVLRPGAPALISTMGPRAMGAFPELAAAVVRLREEGFFFHDGGGDFNSRGAFHSEAGVRRFFGPWFSVQRVLDGGLDGFQDLAVLTRRGE